MTDRLLECAINLVIITLTAGVAGATLVLGYWGLMRLLGGFTGAGGGLLAASAAFGIATHFLTRYKNDLVDR